jgi:hypothetical protein
MTPERFNECLAVLRWSGRSAAEAFGFLSDNPVRAMMAGTRPVPRELATWLERAVAWHQAHPPPVRPGAHGWGRARAPAEWNGE